MPDAAIYVVTQAGRAGAFAGWGLAGVIELPIGGHDDTLRAASIAEIVAGLTERHDWVARLDCDELLVADPRRFASLAEGIAAVPGDYVTAMGFDVVAAPEAPPLDLARPILGEQRTHGFALYAMNKTCLTRRPLRWGRGFHACSERPRFAGLFLMHMKRADIALQFRFGQTLAAMIQGDDFIRDYYLTPIERIRGFHAQLFARTPVAGWEHFQDQAFLAAFEASLRLSGEGLWEFDYLISDKLVEIPPAFRGVV